MADDREIASQQKVCFSNNCQKLKVTSTLEKESVSQELNKILDDLNALDYHITFVEASEVQEILTVIVNLVPCGNDHLLSKFCHFLSNVVYKQQVSLETNCLHNLVGFIIQSIHSCGSWVLTDVLSALAVLLYENVGRLEKFWDTLVGVCGILLQLASTSQKDVDIQHAAFKCLQSLTIRKPGEICLGEIYVGNCFKLFLAVLQELWSSAVEDVALCKVLVSNLRCLQNLFTWHSVPTLQLGDLLGTLKVFMYFGLPGQGSLIPRSLYPTPLCQYIPQVQQQSKEDVALYSRVVNHNRRSRRRVRSRKKQTKGKKDAKGEKVEDDDDDDDPCNITDSEYASHQRSFSSHSYSRSNMVSTHIPIWLKNSSSESEYSDTEGGHVAKLRCMQLNVRHCTFGTLQTVVRATEKKILFGYWSSFLPDCPGSSNGPQNQTILTSVLKDPSPLVRASALALLGEFLRGSKQFLALAEDRNSTHTAFTPLSATMASTVRELHRCLLLVLVAESSSSLLTQLLKCCATLVENSPYHRLHSDLLTKLIKNVRPFLTHRDFQVQVACLTVLGCVVSVQPMPKEVVDVLLEDSFGKPANTFTKAMTQVSCEQDSDNSCRNEVLPWLVKVCLNNVLGANLPPLPVRLESLQLLGLFVGRYFHAMRCHLLLLEEVVVFCVQDPDPFLKLHGAKLLEVTGRCIQNDIVMQKSVSSDENVVSVDVAFGLWQKVINGALPPCLQNPFNPTLRAVSCDCLSTITAPVFHKLSNAEHIMCITILLGLARDEDSSVRGAAVRCLGVYTLFPCLREDIAFLMDVGDVLVLAVEDSNFNVRSKASWALGNLSDALLLNRNEWPELSSEVSNTFLYTLGMASIKASQDCDRTRANAMRALGNLLHYLPKESLEKEQIQELTCQGIQSLLTALGAPVMKVRWNACYALGNVLKNVSLLYSNVISLENIFTGLLSALKDCTNFKVRINAALALSLLPTRDLYGSYFNSAWEHIIAAMDTTNDSVDFKELKHQQNFCDQVCTSFCHLISLLQPEDLPSISHVTLSSGELIISLMKKYGEGNSSDKMHLVTTAANHVLLLPQSGCLSDEESQLLQILLEALDQAKEAQK